MNPLNSKLSNQTDNNNKNTSSNIFTSEYATPK